MFCDANDRAREDSSSMDPHQNQFNYLIFTCIEKAFGSTLSPNCQTNIVMMLGEVERMKESGRGNSGVGCVQCLTSRLGLSGA